MDQPASATARPQDTERPPVLASPPLWPPRIPQTLAPWWIRLRDLLLTLLAWLAYLWILRNPVFACIAWLSPSWGAYLQTVFGKVTNIDIRPYLWIAAGLVAWIVTNGLLRRHRLRQEASPDHAVPALPPEEQFAAAGVPASQVSWWQGARHLHVDHDAQGRIVGATSDPASQ
jgi:poly-beta-1,6-N-acetyl-D-glucosamine biosynthesis protein PgaD